MCVFFYFSLDYFVLVLFTFIVLRFIFSVLHQEIGWEERLRNDLFCVDWAVKPYSVVKSVGRYNWCAMLELMHDAMS